MYTIINVMGITLGISACLVIWIISRYEFGFDKFHPDKERIFRVITSEQLTRTDPVTLTPAVIPPLAEVLGTDIPGVETVAPYHILFDAKVGILKKRNVQSSFASTPIVAGEEYFTIMPYEWLAGDKITALSDPSTVVLSEKIARKYFGSGPLDKFIGRELLYNDSLLTRVTGIVKDWSQNTDFPFTEFISLPTAKLGFLQHSLQLDQDQWKGVPYSSRVLLKLQSNASSVAVSTSLRQLYNKRWPSLTSSIELQSLINVHFTNYGTETQARTAHLPTLYVLMGIALFILVLAIVNYVNLSTAQSISRAKAIGVHKVLGSSKTNLIFQFLLETFLLALFAAGAAALLVQPVLTLFQSFIPPSVRFNPFAVDTILFMLGIATFTTLLGGIYPARLLSAYLPVLVLKGLDSDKGGEKWWLRKGLIVFQFAISLVFIIGTLVIGRQIRFMLNKDLGFRSDAIVLLDNSDSREHLGRVKQFTEVLRKLPGVASIARENMPPMGQDRGIFSIQYTEKSNDIIPVSGIKVDENFIPLYGIRLLAGRNLLPSDTLKEVVINENLCNLLGFKSPGQALGKSIFTWNKLCPIVGVVGDFHQSSFHESITPMLIASMACTDIAIKLETRDKTISETKAILNRVREQWKKFYPDTPFEYTFLDESLAQLYEKEKATALLMNVAAGITIFVSCIGLFGLTLFTTEKRTREIGIRKLLGASLADILKLLTRDFALLVIIGLAIASPIAWFAMDKWLQDYAYRIPLSPDIFLTAGLGLLFLTLITIGFQSVKAALASPVKNLRAE